MFAIMATIVAVLAAGCSGPAQREKKMTKNENSKNIVFRCIGEDYYEDAGFLEVSTQELNQLVENIDEEAEYLIYDSINNYWIGLDSSIFVNEAYTFDSNWPTGQKYTIIFHPYQRFSEIAFIFNAKENKDAELLQCNIGYNGYMFQVVSDNIESLKEDLSRPLYIALDGPMTRTDTALTKKFGLVETME